MGSALITCLIPVQFSESTLYENYRADLASKLVLRSLGQCYCAGCVEDTFGHLGTAPIQFIENDILDDPAKCCCFNCVIVDPTDAEMDDPKNDLSRLRNTIIAKNQYFSYKYHEVHWLALSCVRLLASHNRSVWNNHIIPFNRKPLEISCCCIECIKGDAPPARKLTRLYLGFRYHESEFNKSESVVMNKYENYNYGSIFEYIKSTGTEYSFIPDSIFDYYEIDNNSLKITEHGERKVVHTKTRTCMQAVVYFEDQCRVENENGKQVISTIDFETLQNIYYYGEWHGYKVIEDEDFITIFSPPTRMGKWESYKDEDTVPLAIPEPTCEGRDIETIIRHRGMSNEEIIKKNLPADRDRIFKTLSNWCYGCEKYSGCCSCDMEDNEYEIV